MKTKWRDNPGIQEVNASLIAAAPELLDLCKAASGALQGWSQHNTLVKLLEAAIAKAEGK